MLPKEAANNLGKSPAESDGQERIVFSVYHGGPEHATNRPWVSRDGPHGVTAGWEMFRVDVLGVAI